MKYSILILTLTWPLLIWCQDSSPKSIESPVIREYLHTLDQDLTLFLNGQSIAPDSYTYLRPLEGIHQEGAWLLVPFIPETFGIDQQGKHAVFEFLYSDLQQVNRNHTLPMVFLLKDVETCTTLLKRIQIHIQN